MADAVHLETEGSVGLIVIDNPPVNAGSAAVRAGIVERLKAVGDDPAIAVVVLMGAGTTFMAGSDIKEFGKPLAEPHLPAVIAAIEACPKPVIAAIHGQALGGGFELALGCDGRVASPDAVVGLPEVKLGMIPGAGGTQRTPRLAGIAAAIELITSGRRVSAREAHGLGLIDAILDGDLRSGAVAVAQSWADGKRPLAQRAVPDEPEQRIAEAEQAALKKGRGRPAVKEAIAAIRASASVPFAEALKQERETFQRLRNGEEAAALRHLFFAQRRASRIDGLEGQEPRPVTSVGVVGAGTMGIGIALAFADAGLPTTLVEGDAPALERGLARVRANYDRLVSGQKISAAEAERRVALIAPAPLEALRDVDLIVEAIFEDLEAKQGLLRALGKIAKRSAILASNTSYLDLNLLAAASGRPADVVGLHFFSPANVMRLLEIVQGESTAPDVMATALALSKRLGKVGVVAQVGEGFIGNRIYNAYRTQCEFMLEEGAYPQDIDAALEAFGFAMGPFAVGDLSGLDIAWRMRARLAATRDPRARYVDILDKLCEAGRTGQKAGRGWYAYAPGARRGEPYDEARGLIEAALARKGIVRRTFTSEEIVMRAMAAIVNEAALVLDEGVAKRASDIDLVMVNGFGFPDYRGGPLFWASRRDGRELAAAIDAVETAYGFAFRRGDLSAALRSVADD